MRILVDSNRYQDFCEGRREAVQIIRRASDIMVPFIVLGELRAGFACGTRSHKNEQTLIRFLNSPRVKPLFADEDTTRQYARLFKQLRTQGTPIPVNDLWIAALAIQHDLPLFTRDAHFNHLPQLPVI